MDNGFNLGGSYGSGATPRSFWKAALGLQTEARPVNKFQELTGLTVSTAVQIRKVQTALRDNWSSATARPLAFHQGEAKRWVTAQPVVKTISHPERLTAAQLIERSANRATVAMSPVASLRKTQSSQAPLQHEEILGLDDLFTAPITSIFAEATPVLASVAAGPSKSPVNPADGYRPNRSAGVPPQEDKPSSPPKPFTLEEMEALRKAALLVRRQELQAKAEALRQAVENPVPKVISEAIEQHPVRRPVLSLPATNSEPRATQAPPIDELPPVVFSEREMTASDSELEMPFTDGLQSGLPDLWQLIWTRITDRPSMDVAANYLATQGQAARSGFSALKAFPLQSYLFKMLKTIEMVAKPVVLKTMAFLSSQYKQYVQPSREDARKILKLRNIGGVLAEGQPRLDFSDLTIASPVPQVEDLRITAIEPSTPVLSRLAAQVRALEADLPPQAIVPVVPQPPALSQFTFKPKQFTAFYKPPVSSS